MIRRVYRSARHHLLPRWLSRKLGVRERWDLSRIGSGHGSWVTPVGLLNRNTIAWCAGVGDEISFDLALVREFGCEVWAFDPTPRAIAHVAKVAPALEGYTFMPVGLWSEDKTLTFYAPDNPKNVSHSLTALHGNEVGFDARCRSVRSLMDELGHERIDLLKIDIEGAEYAVLQSLLDEQIFPTVLLVEFDQHAPVRKTLAIIEKLQDASYHLVSVDSWNFTFVRL